MSIQPCHYCGRPQQSNAHFVHEVVCASDECQQKKQRLDEKMRAALQRVLDRDKTKSGS